MISIQEEKKAWLTREVNALVESGMSKAEIARKLQILPQVLTNTLNGPKHNVTDKFISKFNEVFGVAFSLGDYYHEDSPYSSELVISRLKDYAAIKSDAELAALLGYKNQSTLGNWRVRNTIDLERILIAFPNIDLNHIIKGKAERGVDSGIINNLQIEMDRLKEENKTLLEVIRNLSART